MVYAMQANSAGHHFDHQMSIFDTSHEKRQGSLANLARPGVHTGIRRVEAKRAIFHEGDEALTVYEVLFGFVKLYRLLPDGRRLITGFALEGNFFGFVTQKHYTHSAASVTETLLQPRSLSRLWRAVDEDPILAKRLLVQSSDALENAQTQMLLLGRKGAPERVASFLLAMAARQGDGKELAPSVYLPMTRTDIADYLGLVAETVCRALTIMKQRGIIEIREDKHIDLKNVIELSHYAQSDGIEPWITNFCNGENGDGRYQHNKVGHLAA